MLPSYWPLEFCSLFQATDYFPLTCGLCWECERCRATFGNRTQTNAYELPKMAKGNHVPHNRENHPWTQSVYSRCVSRSQLYFSHLCRCNSSRMRTTRCEQFVLSSSGEPQTVPSCGSTGGFHSKISSPRQGSHPPSVWVVFRWNLNGHAQCKSIHPQIYPFVHLSVHSSSYPPLVRPSIIPMFLSTLEGVVSPSHPLVVFSLHSWRLLHVCLIVWVLANITSS